MKYIEKNPEPEEFTRWKERETDKTWPNFKNPLKNIVRDSLIEEQGAICCYCGKRIHKDHNTAIEHMKPRSKHSGDIFNYDNLLASCVGGGKNIVHVIEDENDSLEMIAAFYGKSHEEILSLNREIDFDNLTLRQRVIVEKMAALRPEDLHCDTRKGDLEISVTPLMPDCESFFQYKSHDGEMASTDSREAEDAIRILGLNSRQCKESRKGVLDGVAATVSSIIDLLSSTGNFTKSNLKSQIDKLVEGFNTRNEAGQYAPYCFVCVSYLKNL